ncbi:HdeD family acid-resistance protein [Hymenobacter sublimis]|uniref:HdeD family acid-resistance protein n=1 Tax=Hymenobacter sublimis TaxID=2933777 RepID=A0ABY4J7N1_9BACT|nr:HdeD family acid-resistance protein [Hymenobacter sublimis]UPL48831.1 HdeD family acid-resistance protein [Hymenobacter sublimis]
MLQSVMYSNWWVMALRGLSAVLFGLLTFLMPGLTLLVLITLFGAYCLVNGVLTLITAFRGGRNQPRWWALVLEGAVSLVAGAVTLAWPDLTSLVLLYVVAIWALVTGLLQIGSAIRLRKHITGEWVLMAGGLLSVLFGLILMTRPIAGALVIAWWVGAYAFAFGILLAILAFRLRRQASHQGAAASAS